MKLEDLGATVETGNAFVETDQMDNAPTRPERGAQRRPNSRVGIGKVILVAPAKFYRSGVGKVRQLRQRVGGKIVFVKHDGGVPPIVNNEDRFARFFAWRARPFSKYDAGAK